MLYPISATAESDIFLIGLKLPNKLSFKWQNVHTNWTVDCQKQSAPLRKPLVVTSFINLWCKCYYLVIIYFNDKVIGDNIQLLVYYNYYFIYFLAISEFWGQ